MIEHWYITVKAVHDFQRIVGLPQADDGPLFDRAAKELGELCEAAELKKDIGPGQTSQIWQVKMTLRGRVERLELYVRPAPRSEGDMPQLVRVRHKRRGKRGGKNLRRGRD